MIVYLDVAEVALVPLGVFCPAVVILRLEVSLEDGLRVDLHVAEVQECRINRRTWGGGGKNRYRGWDEDTRRRHRFGGYRQ